MIEMVAAQGITGRCAGAFMPSTQLHGPLPPLPPASTAAVVIGNAQLLIEPFGRKTPVTPATLLLTCQNGIQQFLLCFCPPEFTRTAILNELGTMVKDVRTIFASAK